MKSILPILVAAGILATGIYFFSQKTIPTIENTPTNIQNDSESLVNNNSRYVVYSDSVFNESSDKKRVLYFHAPWCPTCRPTDKEFQENADKIPQDVILFKTDYDTSKELKKKYTITYQHTFVLVDEFGNEITKWNGGALVELIENTQ